MTKGVSPYTKAYRFEGLVLALLCLLGASCDLPPGRWEGKGSLTIILPGAGPRAAHLPEPITGNMSYVLAFYRAGESDPARSIGPTRNKVISVELEPGLWDIEATAHYGMDNNDTAKTASARINGKEILAGQENSVSFEMSADEFITPNRVEGSIQELSTTTGDTPPSLSLTMHTSTAFSKIAGWTDRFSYQWYYEDEGGTQTNVGSRGSFSASGLGNLGCTVVNSTVGAFSYWVKIFNSYTYTPPGGGAPTSGSVEKNIQVAEVTVNPVNPGFTTINIIWPENYLPESITGNMSYVLEFYRTGDHLSDPRIQERTITRELPPGNWDIVATAYYGDGVEPAALGKEPQVEIRAGETVSVPVTMDADHYITPYLDEESFLVYVGAETTSEPFSIKMKTSTVFTVIPGWTNTFSYQIFEGGGDTGTPVGSGGSFAAGSERLNWTVDPSALGVGTVYYYAEITNTYNYTPTSTSGTVTNSIYVGRVVVPHSVGDTGPGGGTVFYRDLVGFFSGGKLCHNLEVGPADLGPAAWGADGFFLGVTASSIGSGYTNTNTIVTWLNSRGETGRLAQIADGYSLGGYDDWFLASKDELDALYHSGLSALVSAIPHSMWSSTEETSATVWTVWGSGTTDDPKATSEKFRPIRAF
jgi:hypothetical protein